MSLVILSSILATLVFGNITPVDHYCDDKECCVNKCSIGKDGLYYTDVWKCDADGSYIYYDYGATEDKPDCNNLGEFISKRIIDDHSEKCCPQNRRLQENNELVFGNIMPVDHYCQDKECCADKCVIGEDGLYYPYVWKCDADGSYIRYEYAEREDKPSDCNNLGEFEHKTIIDDHSKCCSENRRLQENNELNDDFRAMEPNNKMKYTYCVSTTFSLPLGRKFLGLDRSLNLLCKNGWYFKDIGDGEPGEQIFGLYTYTINNLFLSALPDRLSQSVEEKPEEFTLFVADYGIKFTYNIISNYADDEFNGVSLLCHTNGRLIYKDNNVTNKKKDECQWQFGKKLN